MKHLKTEVCLSPLQLPLFELQEKVVVVIDVLRATTTICTALANGAKAVIPVKGMGEALKYSGKSFILAAERHGQKVEGFPFGNSPFEYSEDKVKGKTIVLTTTNGTKAIEMSKEASVVVAGSFLNLGSLCEFLRNQEKHVLLFCAGWKDSVNLEDTLFAGAVVNRLRDSFEPANDAALMAEILHLHTCENVLDHMQNASHYKRLANLGIHHDIQYCFQGDALDVIPVLQDSQLVVAKW